MMLSKIRKLDSSDLDFVWALYLESQKELYGMQWTYEMISESIFKGISLGFFEKNELGAFVLARYQENIIEIDLCITNQNFRRKGLMTTLINSLMNHNSLIKELWLEVHHLNFKALNLYKKMGFVDVGRRKQYYKDGGEALLMTYSCLR